MSTYVSLGTRGPLTGAADVTGNNTGKWTVAFTPAILAFTVPQIEIYKIACTGAPGTFFNVYVEFHQWAANVYGVQNEWEDSNSNLLVRPGESVYFYWSDGVSDNTPPVVTLWIRFDQDLAPNKAYSLWDGLTLTSRRSSLYLPEAV